MGAALLALQARVGTTIRHIYSDNVSYFGQGALSRMELDDFQVGLNTAASRVDSGITVHLNLLFVKCRNVPEHSIKELGKFSKKANN